MSERTAAPARLRKSLPDQRRGELPATPDPLAPRPSKRGTLVEHLADLESEIGTGERLGNELRFRIQDGLGDQGLLSHRGHQQNLRLRPPRAYPLTQGDTVHARHNHVSEQQVYRSRTQFRHLKGIKRVLSFQYVVSALFKHLADYGTELRVVIHDENTLHGHPRALPQHLFQGRMPSVAKAQGDDLVNPHMFFRTSAQAKSQENPPYGR